MNEEPTKDLPDRRSFEERVFARFDAMDARFDAIDARFDTVEVRLEKLESRAYDTKPIWERALKQLLEISFALSEIRKTFGVIDSKLDLILKSLPERS